MIIAIHVVDSKVNEVLKALESERFRLFLKQWNIIIMISFNDQTFETFGLNKKDET